MKTNAASFTRSAQLFTPQSYGTGTANGTGSDTRGFRRALVLVNVGTMAASSTLDVHIEASDTLGGSYTDISGAAFTQLTQAGSDSDTIVASEIDIDQTSRWIRAVYTVGVDAVEFGVVVVYIDPEATSYCTLAADGSEAPTAVAMDFSV